METKKEIFEVEIVYSDNSKITFTVAVTNFADLCMITRGTLLASCAIYGRAFNQMGVCVVNYKR